MDVNSTSILSDWRHSPSVYTIHQVNYQFGLPSKHEEEWGVTCAGMNTRVIGHADIGKLFFSITMSGSGKHV